MDDELPILIYIVGYSRALNLAANFRLVSDYINYYTQYDSESRLIMNLQVIKFYLFIYL